MDDFKSQRDQLVQELQRAEEAFDKEYRSITSAWSGKIGPFVVRATVGGEIITVAYVLFNVVCFAVGIVFTLSKGALQALGISLVVGGLFSFGTFMAQWWDHAWQRQQTTIDRTFGDKRYTELQRIAKELDHLYGKLESLPESSDRHGHIINSEEESEG